MKDLEFDPPENLPTKLQSDALAIINKQIELLAQGKVAIIIPEDIENTELKYW
jgi:hypothetical protein